MRRYWLLLIIAAGCGDSTKQVASTNQGNAQAWTPIEMKPGWGVFVDPDGDCKQTWRDGTLSIEVPGKAHELQGDGKRNAPRLLLDRTDDFAMSVRAAGKLSPQQSTGGKFAPYHGAGLLVVENDAS